MVSILNVHTAYKELLFVYREFKYIRLDSNKEYFIAVLWANVFPDFFKKIIKLVF